jgi:allophanate hydrolase subunit 1
MVARKENFVASFRCNRCNIRIEGRRTFHVLCKDCLPTVYSMVKPQAYSIYELLCSFQSLTVRFVADRIGCNSLAPRIHELRKAGVRIRTDRKRNTNNDGSYAVYNFEGGNNEQ